MNIDETRLPERDAFQAPGEPGETCLPQSALHREGAPQSAALSPGDSLAGSYIVNEPLGESGKQADVYLAKKDGRSCVIKLYHQGWRPTDQLQSFLTGFRHPNVAHVIENGDHRGRHYEIYEYYAEGTLEQKKQYTPAFIQKVIVPSMNEGLHALHKNGIVHCDIKPSNIFLGENSEKAVIGDCGISGYLGPEGKFIDKIRGTPEYAPRTKTFFGSASMAPAYDYGSLGLVLIRLCTGYSFFGGMSINEIAATWERGIAIPNQISGRLRELVQGLLLEEEDARWGYKEVKRWCENEFIRPADRSLYKKKKADEKPIRPLIFGRFDEVTVSVSTLHQLTLAIHKHWSHVPNLLKRRELSEFLLQFDEDATFAKTAQELARLRDQDAATFQLLYMIEKVDRIHYRGRDFGSLDDFLALLESAAEPDPDVVAFVKSGMFTYYLRLRDADSAQIEALERVIQKDGLNNIAAIKTLCYSLKKKKELQIANQTISTSEDFVDAIAHKTTGEISDLLENGEVIAWLYSIGFQKEILKMSALQEGVS
ncbi:MAG: protein kinase [Clostridiales bacterium]|nr:protein kinase [Clostridiales bacterium]